jgi:hypothetical protein
MQLKKFLVSSHIHVHDRNWSFQTLTDGPVTASYLIMMVKTHTIVAFVTSHFK